MKLDAEVLRGVVISIGFGGALFLSYVFSDQPWSEEVSTGQAEILKIQPPAKSPVEVNLNSPARQASLQN